MAYVGHDSRCTCFLGNACSALDGRRLKLGTWDVWGPTPSTAAEDATLRLRLVTLLEIAAPKTALLMTCAAQWGSLGAALVPTAADGACVGAAPAFDCVMRAAGIGAPCSSAAAEAIPRLRLPCSWASQEEGSAFAGWCCPSATALPDTPGDRLEADADRFPAFTVGPLNAADAPRGAVNLSSGLNLGARNAGPDARRAG